MVWEWFPEAIGSVGVLLAVSAYALKEIKYGFGDSVAYSIMNIASAVPIMISLSFDWNMASMMQELIWFVVGSLGLFNCYMRERRKRQTARIAKEKPDQYFNASQNCDILP